MAGTFGDPVRSVENLPGVLRSSPDSDGVVIWGARADDSRVLVDGIEVPALLHVGSQRSAIGVNAPDSLQLLPGAYAADYGRALGGLVLIATRDLATEGGRGAAEANLADASLLVSSAPTSHFRLGLSGTWSYSDHMPDRFGERPTTLYKPARYRDFQAKAELDISPQRRLTTLVLGATEAAQPSDARNYYDTRRYLPHERAWYRFALRYTDDRKNGATVMPFVGWTRDDLDREASPNYPPDARHLRTLHYGLRAARHFWLGDAAVLTASLDGLFERTRASQAGGSFTRTTDEVMMEISLAPFAWSSTVGDVAGALSLRWQIGRWTVTPAFRADVFPTFVDGGAGAEPVRHAPVTLGPRLALQYVLHPSLELHAAAGLYSQPARAADLSSTVGNPWLGPSQAAHGRLGLRWRVTGATSVEATGFARESWALPVSAPDGSHPTSEGRARVYGAELMVRKEVSAQLDAWLAYTIGRSQIRQGASNPWTLSPQDRTHAVTAVFVHRWRGWLTSARFRYASGVLYTPVETVAMNATMDRYEPIYGTPNSARLRAFIQADVRLGRELRIGPGTGAVYLDITNATSRGNAEALRAYSYDFAEYSTINSPPRSYLLGARWQW